MEVFTERNKEKKQIKFNGTAKALLEKLKINPEEVLVTKNQKIITLDTKLEDKDKVKILSVISGG